MTLFAGNDVECNESSRPPVSSVSFFCVNEKESEIANKWLLVSACKDTKESAYYKNEKSMNKCFN